MSAAQHDFDRAKENKVYIYQRVEEVESGHRPTADETEQFFSFDTWCDAVKKYAFLLANDTYDYDQHKYLALEEERMKPMNVSEAIVMNTLPFGYFGLDSVMSAVWVGS